MSFEFRSCAIAFTTDIAGVVKVAFMRKREKHLDIKKYVLGLHVVSQFTPLQVLVSLKFFLTHDKNVFL